MANVFSMSEVTCEKRLEKLTLAILWERQESADLITMLNSDEWIATSGWGRYLGEG